MTLEGHRLREKGNTVSDEVRLVITSDVLQAALH